MKLSKRVIKEMKDDKQTLEACLLECPKYIRKYYQERVKQIAKVIKENE